MSRPKWTPEQDAILREMAANGAPAQEIADAIDGGFSRYAVLGRAHRIGVNIFGSPWTGARNALLTKLAGQGLSAAEIAARFGGAVSSSSVLHHAHFLGLHVAGMKPKDWKPKPRAWHHRRKTPRVKRQTFVFGPRANRDGSKPATAFVFPNAPVPESRPVLFVSRRMEATATGPEQCAWPLWDDATPILDRLVCGAPVACGAYCAGHARLAYQDPDIRPARKLEAAE